MENNENGRKPLKMIPYSEPLFDLYYIYGSLLAGANRFDEAEVYLKKKGGLRRERIIRKKTRHDSIPK